MSSVTMSPVPWKGGKGMIWRKILPYLPKGKIYVEPFCGGSLPLFPQEATSRRSPERPPLGHC